MSQLLLVQTDEPPTALDGISFAAIADDMLALAAAHNFGQSLAWNVIDNSGGMDSLADTAREALLAGGKLQDTLLGQFLLEQASQGRGFCLFWASDFQDLPEADNPHELLGIIAEQLSSDGSWNYEMYARWRGVTVPGGA